MKILVFKATKSIDFTMLLIRVGQTINPFELIRTLKTMIMIKIEKVKKRNHVKKTGEYCAIGQDIGGDFSCWRINTFGVEQEQSCHV